MSEEYLMCCRVCLHTPNLENPDLMKNVYEHYQDDHNYSEMYEYCVEYSINSDADKSFHLPYGICDTCENNLLISFAFRKQCLETVEYLRSLQPKDYDCVDGSESSVKEEQNEFENEEHIEEIETIEENIVDTDEIEYQESTDDTQQSATNIEFETTTTRSSNRSKKTSNMKTRGKKSNNGTSICPVCGKIIKHYNLQIHLITHENIPYEERPFVCELCGKRFKKKDTLRSHKQSHTRELKYACPFCDKKFHVWHTKNQHVIQYHTGEYTYQCNMCQQKFCVSSAYKKHMRTHTGEKAPKNFKCTVCSKEFENMGRLKIHQISHSDERNVKCEYCHKSYKTIKSLKVHLRNHTGEKNYECPVCPSSFTQNLLLRNHVSSRHPDYELPPPGTILNKKYLEKLAIDNAKKIF